MDPFLRTATPIDLPDLWLGTRCCPACTGWLAHVTNEPSQWLCESCGRCWHARNGRLHRVDPLGCSGCDARHQTECLEVLQETFPRFGPRFGADPRGTDETGGV